ncbi:MAG TPA: hypothetical protein VML50_09120 [Anaeromyxobacter sp.]|nr:hypothetical protein [Anaeromyxobacter sp.]
MKKLLIAAAVLLPALALAEPHGMEAWQHNHPEAARELGEWVRVHPAAAQLFFTWDGHHPERCREFVTWTIEHPRQNIDVFVMERRGWPVFDQIMEQHRPAAEAFMAWCRRHPRAAEALVSHPRGLEWAGHHLYAADWHMEHPNR